jgi:hypothetical protein
MIRAFHAGYPGMKVGLVLKNIKMTPSLHGCIVDLATILLANRTGKCTSYFEVKVDVNLPFFLIKRNVFDYPRLFKLKNLLKKRLQVVHWEPPE